MKADARFELDPSVRRRDRGRLLIGGTPPRLMRLSEAGARALDALLDNDAPDPGQAVLADRLTAAGLLHPLPGDGVDDPPVTTVIPVLDGGEALGTLVRTLVAEGPVIVVDDGSRDGSAARAADAGARVIPNPGPPGPASARNAGLDAATTELVAFLDADCVVASGWRRGLAALFAAEPRLALVAPRVRGLPVDAAVDRDERRASPLDPAIGRYEQHASPLDLGAAASRVGPDRRVAYLPAAALVARRDALRELGGFDESMRFGEDVDLVWRLIASGHEARYVPSREAHHRPRPTVAALARQRAGYGSSAPRLRRRHGDAVAPLRLGRHTVAVWAVAALRPRLAPVALAASLALVARRGSDTPARLGLVEVALRGHLDGTRHLARALAREWLPLTLLALAAGGRRTRRPLAAALLLDTLGGPVARATGPGELAAFLALRIVDRGAYGFGLWREMVRERRFSAIRPAREHGERREPRD
jgi:mycofactocin system glycosyltransferase